MKKEWKVAGVIILLLGNVSLNFIGPYWLDHNQEFKKEKKNLYCITSKLLDIFRILIGTSVKKFTINPEV